MASLTVSVFWYRSSVCLLLPMDKSPYWLQNIIYKITTGESCTTGSSSFFRVCLCDWMFYDIVSITVLLFSVMCYLHELYKMNSWRKCWMFLAVLFECLLSETHFYYFSLPYDRLRTFISFTRDVLSSVLFSVWFHLVTLCCEKLFPTTSRFSKFAFQVFSPF
jgi:hypothetical protein